MAGMQSNEPYERVFDGTGAIVGAGIGGVMSGGAAWLASKADKTYDDRVNSRHDNLIGMEDSRLQGYVDKAQKRANNLEFDFDSLQEKAKNIHDSHANYVNNLNDSLSKNIDMANNSNTTQDTKNNLINQANDEFISRFNNANKEGNRLAENEVMRTRAEPGGKKYRKLQNAEDKQYNAEQRHARKMNEIEESRANKLRKGSAYSRFGGGWKNAVGVGIGAAVGTAVGGFGTAGLKRMDEE